MKRKKEQTFTVLIWAFVCLLLVAAFDVPSNAQNPLTMVGTSYDSTTAKFGAALSAGTGSNASLSTYLFSVTTFTVEGWIKTGTSATTTVAISDPGSFWIGKDSSNHLTANYTGGNITTTSGIADNTWHHVALCLGSSGAKLFLDGTLVASNATVQTTGTSATNFSVGTYTSVPSFNWLGETDEVAVWSTAKYSTTFTPPSSPYTGTESGLVSLYHLDSSGADSKQVVPAAPTALAGVPANSQVSLSWTAPAGAINSYNVKRSTTSGSGYATISTSGTVIGTSYVDTTAVNGTAYYYVVSAVNAAGESANSAEVGPKTPFLAAANVLPNSAALLYSPYNWLVTSGAAKTINAGAYFRTIIGTTTSCTVNLTIGSAAPYSEVEARFDNGPWQVYIPTASGAQAWTLTMPTNTTSAKHLLEFIVKSTTETQDRWTTQATAVQFTGLTLDSGFSVSLPASRKFRVIMYGDSITEGVRVYGVAGGSVPNDTDRNDNTQDYSYALGPLLNAEVGVIGFGASGFTITGSGNVPALPTSYSLLWSGQARSFSPVPDLVIYNEGTNESGATLSVITTALQTVINGIGYTGTANTSAGLNGTRHLVLRPFIGYQAANLSTIVSGYGNTNIAYGDTTGFWASSDSSDNLHPYGYAHIGNIAPQVANLALPLLTSTVAAATGRGRRLN